MNCSVFKVREGSCVVLPLAISEKQGCFAPREEKIENKFLFSISFGKFGADLNEKTNIFECKSFILLRTQAPGYLPSNLFGKFSMVLNEKKLSFPKEIFRSHPRLTA